MRRQAQAVGAVTRLYWLQCPDEVALARCLQRNGEPDVFLFSPDAYRALQSRFAPPTADEEAEVVITG